MNNLHKANALKLTRKGIYANITVLIISTLVFIILYPYTKTFLENTTDPHSFFTKGLNYLCIFFLMNSVMIAAYTTSTLIIHTCSLAVQYLSNFIFPKVSTGFENLAYKLHNAAVRIIGRRK